MDVTDAVAEAVAKTTWPDLWATVNDANKRLLMEGARHIFAAGVEAGHRDPPTRSITERDRERMARALRSYGLMWCSGSPVAISDAISRTGPLDYLIEAACSHGN